MKMSWENLNFERRIIQTKISGEKSNGIEIPSKNLFRYSLGAFHFTKNSGTVKKRNGTTISLENPTIAEFSKCKAIRLKIPVMPVEKSNRTKIPGENFQTIF